MHLQIQLRHAQLAHHIQPRQEKAVLLQLHQHLSRQRLIRLPMAGIRHDALRNPHPVLVNLAGQLHKIARHAGTGVGVKLRIAQHAVQRMPELMEKRQHIQVRQEGRFALRGRFQVAHQHTEMRRALAIHHRIMAQAHDPGAIRLGAAGVQVHIHRAHVAARCHIVKSIQLHLRKPHLLHTGRQLLTRLRAAGGDFRNADIVQSLINGEHARQHVFLLVVRAQSLAVEPAELLTHQAHVVRHVPGVDLGKTAARAL